MSLDDIWDAVSSVSKSAYQLRSRQRGENMSQAHDLSRFLEAQNKVVDLVMRELKAGEKRSHWMWYVFPQIRGLGTSSVAQRYAIQSLDEAVAFYNHEVLGARLKLWTELVLATEGKTAEGIFGYPDYLKFRSCMTLFEVAQAGEPAFSKALDKYYGGKRDERTLSIIQRH